MKTVVPFLFIVITMLCLTPLAESNRTWGGINLIANYAFISYLCWQKEIATPEKNEKERLFYQYSKWLTFFNCPYILACIIRGSYWSVWNTDTFAYVLGIGFLFFILHCALNNKS